MAKGFFPNHVEIGQIEMSATYANVRNMPAAKQH